MGKIGSVMFGFVYHYALFPVYKTLDTPNAQTWRKASKMGLSFMWVVEVVVPIVGGMGSGIDLAADNVLCTKHLDPESVSMMMKALQVAFGIVMLLSYPFQAVLSREYIESIVAQCQGGERDHEADAVEKDEISNTTSVVITLCVMGAHLPFLFSEDASHLAADLLDIVGSLASGSLGFVFPSILLEGASGEGGSCRAVL